MALFGSVLVRYGLNSQFTGIFKRSDNFERGGSPPLDIAIVMSFVLSIAERSLEKTKGIGAVAHQYVLGLLVMIQHHFMIFTANA